MTVHCSECGLLFTRRDNLFRHMRNSHEEFRYFCIYCKRSGYKDESGVRKHVLLKHSGSPYVKSLLQLQTATTEVDCLSGDGRNSMNCRSWRPFVQEISSPSDEFDANDAEGESVDMVDMSTEDCKNRENVCDYTRNTAVSDGFDIGSDNEDEYTDKNANEASDEDVDADVDESEDVDEAMDDDLQWDVESHEIKDEGETMLEGDDSENDDDEQKMGEKLRRLHDVTRSHTYWSDPNKLVDRLKDLFSSGSSILSENFIDISLILAALRKANVIE